MLTTDNNYCLLTGRRCSHFPISVQLNSFFISEPYDDLRADREHAIEKTIEGFPRIIADHTVMNIALTCKICQQIRSSEFGIVDISGSNANVLIELGMLYGLNKPTIILLKKDELPSFKVPSNVIGIEQVRYENFEQLTGKLKLAVATLLKFRNEEREYVIDMKPILENLFSDLKSEIEARKLFEKKIKAQIIDFKKIGDLGVLILNKGVR
jgi:hypothetical protein